MSFERDSNRIVIAGASSLLGAELKSLLEESRFAASDFRLLDEELAAGILTEAGGEPAVIRGASSLRGAELKSLLEESRFAASDFRLLDEELAAGILTEAGGEPAVIRPVEEDSFEPARF